jgi:catechol 2,3-dioxygenase-like lactoylglutathione lyase family enzyme
MAMQDSGSAQSVATSPSPGQQPRFSGFSHLTIPCKDLEQSRRFFTEVLGGEIAHPGPKLEVRIGGTLVTFSPASGGWTARDSEYPHYAFFIEPEDFLPMKARLESYGVPTTEPWTRDDVKALMYFRDPSGNLFEMYCAQGFKGKLRRGARAGGDYVIDFEALNYDWKY